MKVVPPRPTALEVPHCANDEIRERSGGVQKRAQRASDHHQEQQINIARKSNAGLILKHRLARGSDSTLTVSLSAFVAAPGNLSSLLFC